MKNVVALALFAVAADQGGSPTCEPGVAAAKPVSDQAIQCVLANARRLESSGERADLVATAALNDCDGQIAKLRHALTSACGYSLGMRVEEKLRLRLTDMAIAEVVKKRAR